jgi:hypothetical protein
MRHWRVSLVLGVILIGLGCFIGLRPLFTHNATLTGPRWLDVTFALVFMIRGTVNVKTALRRKQRG